MKRANYQDSYQLYINGQWKDAADGATFNTYCPANGELLSICAEATKQDVDEAVASAWSAWESWKKTSYAERAVYLNKIADVITENLDNLAMIESLDTGKPIWEATAVDIPGCADHFRYFASVIRAEEGSATMIDEHNMSIVLREPLGVVGLIVPWNFPFSIAGWKLAPALAAGCTVVFKPSSSTPLSVLELARLTQDILPPGVLNVVTGSGGKAGEYILQHPDLRKLSFTGSTEVGYRVAQAAAQKIIPATLELGGKSANIFFEDCDLEKSVAGMQGGILFCQGEVCCSGSRVFVQESIYDEFLTRSIENFQAVKVGMPWEADTQMGAIIFESHLQSILSYVEKGKAEGATVACGGKRLTANGMDRGCFMAPTILTNVTNDMTVAQEEIFGPVVVFIKFKTEEEVIRMANDSEYGLAGGVWTKNLDRAIRVARAVETGRMWVNTYGMLPPGIPFGGYKKSGIGRETHKMALDYYTQVKSIMINIAD